MPPIPCTALRAVPGAIVPDAILSAVPNERAAAGILTYSFGRLDSGGRLDSFCRMRLVLPEPSSPTTGSFSDSLNLPNGRAVGGGRSTEPDVDLIGADGADGGSTSASAASLTGVGCAAGFSAH